MSEVFQKVGLRMKYHYPGKSSEVQIGRESDIVFSVHFRNEGLHSLMRVGINGAYFTLRPGEEKEFAVTPPYAIQATFDVLYEFENQSDWLASGSQKADDSAAQAEAVNRSVISELYLIGVQGAV